jgi:ribosome biogenesis GTPase
MAVDARATAAGEALSPWCTTGQTIALVGSSGVGKSTLVNTLTGAALATAASREHDQRGRHTTSRRSMHRTASGAWIIDTPGMRALGLVDAEAGLEQVFEEIVRFAADCRFADCRHESEPGCAVKAAIETGLLSPARLARYRKLESESRRNAESLAERRARFKAFGRLAKSVQQTKSSRRDLS